VEITFLAKNLGSAASPKQDIGFYLSSDSTIDTSDHQLGYLEWQAINAGEEDTIIAQVPIPKGWPNGTYYIGMIADYDQKIVEKNETNNISTGVKVVVKPWEDRVVDLGTLSSNVPNIDKTFSIPEGVDGEYVFKFNVKDPVSFSSTMTGGSQFDAILEADAGNKEPTLGAGPDRHLRADHGFGGTGDTPQVIEDPLMPGHYTYTITRHASASGDARGELSINLKADETGNNYTWAKEIGVARETGTSLAPQTGVLTTIDNKDVWKFTLTERSSVLVSLAVEGQKIDLDGSPPLHYTITTDAGALDYYEVLDSHTDAISPYIDTAFTRPLVTPGNIPPQPGDYYDSDPGNVPLDPGTYYISIYKSGLTKKDEKYSVAVNAWADGAANRPTITKPSGDSLSANIGSMDDRTFAHDDFLGLADRNDYFVFTLTKRSAVSIDLDNPAADASINIALTGTTTASETPGPYTDIHAGGGDRAIKVLLEPGTYALRAYTETSFSDPSGTRKYGDTFVYPANGGAHYDLKIAAATSTDGTLPGTTEPDTFYASPGPDKLLFANKIAKKGNLNIDTIFDYNPIDDTLQLDRSIFKKLKPGYLKNNAFLAGDFNGKVGKAKDKKDKILYDTDTGNLFFDVDGKGGKKAIHFAVLDGSPELTAADFLIVA
jgi:hypothetical protein